MSNKENKVSEMAAKQAYMNMVETRLFSAYLHGKENPTESFHSWNKANNVTELLFKELEEYFTTTTERDRIVGLIEALKYSTPTNLPQQAYNDALIDAPTQIKGE